MPRLVALLCLTLALAGQPLRQAEAASDLARALTELIAVGGVLEIPDGGVGDDAGVATLKAASSSDSNAARSPSWDLPFAIDTLQPSSFLAPLHDPGASRCLHEHTSWLPSDASRRHAWLQRLLF